MPSTPVIEARNIVKKFGHVQALRDASIEAYSGEVLALVGDNGAGKSTLMKVVTGVHRPDGGQLIVQGSPADFHSPLDARNKGVAAVFQDLALVESMDVASNMYLGETPTRRFVVDRRKMDDQAVHFLQQMGVKVYSPRTPVGMLSGGQRQLVAIARAIRLNAPVIIMDEPTAALGVRETAQVASIIGRLRNEGKAVIIVSHDFELVFDLADRIQVMRLGSVAAVVEPATTSRDQIVSYMTGSHNTSTSPM